MNESLNEQQLSDLRQAFASVDRNNHGVIDTKDIPSVFAQLDETYKSFVVEGDHLKRLVERIDLEDSKQLTFAQFLTLIAYKLSLNETEEELQEAFRIFDRSNSGYITLDDVWHAMQRLGENLTKGEVKEMMREADRDLSGRISLAEFAEMIRHS